MNIPKRARSRIPSRYSSPLKQLTDAPTPPRDQTLSPLVKHSRHDDRRCSAAIPITKTRNSKPGETDNPADAKH